MPENATPDESVQIIIPPDTVVDADNPLPVTVVAGSGSAAVTIADGADVVEGAKADAAWNGTPGSTTIMAVLKAIYGKAAATLGFSVNAGTTDATTLRVITASDGPLNTNLGATTDAAVTTDANASVSSKLRGLVKLFNDVWDSTNHVLKTGETVNVAGTPTHTPDATVDATAGGVTLIGSNASRKAAFIQNVGSANIRVSVGGTPATATGLQLVPGATLILESPFCPTGAVKAIRETSTSSAAAVLEIA